jgi:ribosome maturation factor RimP
LFAADRVIDVADVQWFRCPVSIFDEEVVVVASTESIRALARPLLAAAGLGLWDVEITEDVVRVLIDRDGGVDLDALSAASHVVSDLLDDHDDLVPVGQYQLEVSSPGLERVLRTPEQYRLYLGATVTVKTLVAVEGGRRHRGILVAADDLGIALQPDAAPGGPPTPIPYDQIERTRTVLDWGPAPKPGSRAKTAGRPKAAGRSDKPGSPGVAARDAEPAQDPKDRAR